VPGLDPLRTAPDDVERVQELRAANAYKIPIYTISSGKKLGYGGSALRLNVRATRLLCEG
jgi:hypothetical protein